MRNQILAGNVSMMYPDECTFINDRNTITLHYLGVGNNTVGGAFTFTNQQGTAVQIAYNSEQIFLTFNLFSVLKKLMNNDVYNVVTVTGSVVCGETATNIHPFTLKCIDGRTLHSREHNSERIIYYYEPSDLYGVEILSLYGGTVNGFTVQAGVNKFNLSSFNGDFQITQVDGDFQRTIYFKNSTIGGDNTYCVDDSDEEGTGNNSNGGVFRVRYFNTDGCMRHLIGKITSRKRTVGYTDWRADELVRHTPNGMITTTTDEITVGFPAIARKSYAEDIMFSSRIEYVNQNGEWQPCILSTKNINLPNWDENDIEITFKTLA